MPGHGSVPTASAGADRSAERPGAAIPARVTPDWDNRAMAFGQAAGPPATRRQIQDLTELIRAAGHVDFRDARGPLGLTQRQAGGRFTRDEADALITRLQAEADLADVEPGGDAAPGWSAPHPRDRREAQLVNQLSTLPAETLAAELQRRGWVVMEP